MALGDRDAEVCKLHSSECYQDAEYSFEELPKRATNELPVSENDEDKLPMSKNYEEEHKTGKSPCQKRKRTAVLSKKRKGTAVHFPVDEIEDGADENWEPALETSNASVMDDEDEDNGEGVTVKQKRTFKKQKRQEGAHNPSNDSKSRRGRKNSSEGHDQSNVDPQKRKFSHSTKRNRRRVDKALLETPEEEIDPTKLVMKDLILLAEANERKLNKESAARSKSVPTQRSHGGLDDRVRRTRRSTQIQIRWMIGWRSHRLTMMKGRGHLELVVERRMLHRLPKREKKELMTIVHLVI